LQHFRQQYFNATANGVQSEKLVPSRRVARRGETETIPKGCTKHF